MFNEIISTFIGQLRQEPANELASQQYSTIERIKRDVEVAHYLKEDGDCGGVISLLSQVLDVSNCAIRKK